MSFSKKTVPWEDHVRWFGNILNDVNTILYMADLLGETEGVGYVRFDKVQSECSEISIALNPLYRSRKLGQPVLAEAIEKFFAETGKDRCSARVLEINKASVSIFEKVGFVKKRGSRRTIEYELAKTDLQAQGVL